MKTAQEIIAKGIALCEADARAQGWVGDCVFEPTFLECASIALDVRKEIGRMPTKAEWEAAGYKYVGGRHCAD